MTKCGSPSVGQTAAQPRGSRGGGNGTAQTSREVKTLSKDSQTTVSNSTRRSFLPALRSTRAERAQRSGAPPDVRASPGRRKHPHRRARPGPEGPAERPHEDTIPNLSSRSQVFSVRRRKNMKKHSQYRASKYFWSFLEKSLTFESKSVGARVFLPETSSA